MRGECFGIRALSRRTHSVSTHICAGNVSSSPRITPHIGPRFNSYMRGECFVQSFWDFHSKFLVSTHMCAGNVPGGIPGGETGDCVSTHICAGNVSYKVRCIYDRHIRFNSYMHGECFKCP